MGVGRKLSLGVHVGQQNIGMAELRALWRRLESAGVDWISIWDHFFESPCEGGVRPHFEALATLGALAAETRRPRIGCLVFCVGYRNPALLAKAATTLDHISGGRFELGLGAGWHIWEATAYGYPFPDLGTRLDMLDEAAGVVRQLLDEPRATFSGRHYQLDDASCLPKPVQRHLPLWIGGRGERRTLEIAARRADGWNAPYVGPAEFGRLNGVLDHWCEADDRDGAAIRRGVNVAFYMACDAAGVARQRARLAADWREQAGRIEDGALLCTPQQAVERLLAYAENGASDINISLRAPWDREALDAYLDEVLPQVRREIGAGEGISGQF